MSPPLEPPHDDDLLRHRDWLQRLARVLTHDSNDADDLEQQTWLAALESPPAELQRPRAWLGTVVRSWLHRRGRSDQRRTRREQTASQVERVHATDDLAARAELARLVGHAVRRLDEPLRTVVVLRFYEGLTVRQIAVRMQTPYETTRSRLRTALRRLRTTVTPEADPRFAIAMPLWMALQQSVSAPLKGLFVMSKTTKIVALALAATTVGVGGVWVASLALTPVERPDDLREVAERHADQDQAEDPRVARLQARVAELEHRLSRRERRVERQSERTHEALRSSNETVEAKPPLAENLEGTVWGALRHTIRLRGGSLVTETEKTEAEPAPLVDIHQLSDDELLRHAQELSKASKAEARGAWQALVDRQPVQETLDLALYGLGIAERRAGDHAAELVSFERLADLAGPDTQRGQEARYQRAWALYFAKDYANATREMESLADATDGRTDRARHALLNGSTFAEKLGDLERSRVMLTRLQRAVADDKSSLARWFKRSAAERLKAQE